MAGIDVARLMVLDRQRADFKRISDKTELKWQTLDALYRNKVPNPIPKLKDMTDQNLEDLKTATKEILGMALILENEAKFDLLKLDKEIMSRR